MRQKRDKGKDRFQEESKKALLKNNCRSRDVVWIEVSFRQYVYFEKTDLLLI